MYFFNAEKYRRKEMYMLEPIPAQFSYVLGHRKYVPKVEVKPVQVKVEVKVDVKPVEVDVKPVEVKKVKIIKFCTNEETPDKWKEYRRLYSLDYYKLHKDTEFREKVNEKAREIYHALTPEQKKIVNKKKQEYIKQSIREKLSDPITAEILRQKWRDERKKRNDRIKLENLKKTL
jgi:hypothetical protein